MKMSNNDGESSIDNNTVSSTLTNDNLDDQHDYVDVPENEVETIAKAMSMGISVNQKELLHIHFSLKHLPFSYLKQLAQQGVIPKYLEKVEPPLCTACLMGKQHRKPWRGRGKDKKIHTKTTR